MVQDLEDQGKAELGAAEEADIPRAIFTYIIYDIHSIFSNICGGRYREQGNDIYAGKYEIIVEDSMVLIK